MSGEPEPRRSVRSTKGQHKALDQLEQTPLEPKRRARKGKAGKAGGRASTDEKASSPEEEVIRCICGATEQDEDSGEPWIACDKCGAWQHNVCMGMSVYGEDLPNEYYCEQCRPDDHKELLEGVAKGEKPWEERRRAYEEEQARRKKKGPKKGGKRVSDQKDEQPSSSQTSSKGAKASPAPEIKKEPKGLKRKHDDAAQDKDSKVAPKMRRVSETQAAPVPAYTPPEDLPGKITELLDARQGPAKALMKSISFAITTHDKKGIAAAAGDGLSAEARAERLAIQVERAVHDTHPNQKEYNAQIRTLTFNLKNNLELCAALLGQALTPPMLAAMTTDELASQELQRETAEMKARAEKQSIRLNEEGPRIRRTHKGDEVIGEDGLIGSEEVSSGAVRRPSGRDRQRDQSQDQDTVSSAEPEVELPSHIDYQPKGDLRIDTRGSPKTDFDINKVFSRVRSPNQGHARRPSQPATANGPGVDPEVDRLLQDDGNESPPYSPTDETDPEAVWRGNLVMPSVANCQVTAKYVGGANLNQSIGLPWTQLFPKNLTVAGRIDEQKANEYLCGQRYSSVTDLVIVELTPAYEPARPQFQALVDYFVSKKRYGVVGDKGSGNVRDTYLIPVLPGTGNHPEFMLNLEDNQDCLPQTRTEPTLLVVFVYKNNPTEIERLRRQSQASQSPLAHTPTPVPSGSHAQRSASVSGPSFSPASPQGAFPPHQPQAVRGQPSQTPQQQPQQQQPQTASDAAREAAQRQGEADARDILGPLISCATAAFLLPQAYQMNRREWELVRSLYDRDPRARDDLQYLSSLIYEAGERRAQEEKQAQQQLQTHQRPPLLPSHSQAPTPSAQGNAGAPAPARLGPAIPHKQTPIPLPQIPGVTAPALQPDQGQARAAAAYPPTQTAAPPPA